MNDKQILDQVYVDLLQWKKEMSGCSEGSNIRISHDRVQRITDFIEQEWQKADEKNINNTNPQQEAGVDY